MIRPTRPAAQLWKSCPSVTMPNRFCMNAEGFTMVNRIRAASISASDRSCIRPFRVGASYAAPIALAAICSAHVYALPSHR